MLPRYAEYSFTLAAGASQAVPLTGNFVTCIEASANFSLGIGDEPTTTFREGLSFRVPDGEAFRSLRLENPSGASITVTIGVGRGDLADNRSTIGGTVVTSEDLGSTIIGGRLQATGVAAEAVAANAARKSIVLRSEDTNTANIWIGSSALGAYSWYIQPGESVVIDDFDGALWARSWAGSVWLYWMEISS